MFEIRAADFVCYLRRSLLGQCYTDRWEWLDDGSIRKPGIQVVLDCRMCDYGGTDVKRHASVFFVMCGETNVFGWYDTGGTTFGKPPYAEFQNLSNHDIGWRSGVEDLLTNLYFKWAKEISPDKPPRDIAQHCFIGMGDHKMVNVTVAIDPKKNEEFYGHSGSSYFQRIVEVTNA